LEGYEITGQSLLTRDISNNWKFAHKSIFEFFIAEKAMENVTFGFHLDINGLDMTKKFIIEIDKVSSLYLFKYCPILFGEISYMQITKSDYELIMERRFTLPQYRTDSDSFMPFLFSKHSAIRFCNELNEIFGYRIRYDKDGNLFDGYSFNRAIDKSTIKGFIFPSMSDFDSFLCHQKAGLIFRLRNVKFDFLALDALFYCALEKSVVEVKCGLRDSKDRKNRLAINWNTVKRLSLDKTPDIHKIWPDWSEEMINETNFEFDINKWKIDYIKRPIVKIEENSLRPLRLVFVDNPIAKQQHS
jgi:hypothetical protein